MTTALPWWFFALLSALFGGTTAILAKVGIQGVPSNLATALRSVVVVAFTWVVVLAYGEQRAIPQLSTKTFVFLGLSAVTTSLSWLVSVAVAVIMAWVFLGEPVAVRTAAGATLIVAGVLLCIK